MASQVPTNVSTYFYDASCIALSFSDPSSAYFNNAQPYYYIASAVDTAGNKTTYATGYKSPIYIQGLSAGYTYNCSLYVVQTASSDSISFTTLSYPTVSDISLSDVSFNFINVKWTATDVSYVKVTRRIGTTQPYLDICGGDYASPYYDSDISGNTTYYYYITPYMTKYGSTTGGSLSSVVSAKTPVAYPTDVSAIYYDASNIRLSFTAPKNTYTSVAPSYTAKAVYGGNTYTASGSSPILIQNLSSGTTYTCYILTYFDSALQSTSLGLNVTTSSLSTLVIWLDANLSSTITQTNGYVTNWADRSGKGHNAIPYFSSTAHTYSTTFLDSAYPGVKFSGGGMYCSTFSLINTFSKGSITIFLVIKVTSGVNFCRIFNTGTWDQANSTFSIDFYNDERWVSTSRDTTPYTCFNFNTVMSQRSIFCMRVNYSDYSYKEYQNGTLLKSTTTTSYSIPPTLTRNFFIGGMSSNQALNAVIGEIMVYNSALSTTDMNSTMSYLGTKWNVTVSTIT